jgi:predicted phage tail protein
MRKLFSKTSVGWMAVAIGVATAVTPAWAETTAAGGGFMLGLGAMAVIYGVWSLIARDPTRDHLGAAGRRTGSGAFAVGRHVRR